MKIAILLNVLDFISGTAAAIKNHNIKSSRMRDGLFKKFGFVLLYVVGYAWEHWGGELGLPYGAQALTAMCIYISSIEVISLVENLHQLNADIVPHKILSLLKMEGSVKNDNDNAGKT